MYPNFVACRTSDHVSITAVTLTGSASDHATHKDGRENDETESKHFWYDFKNKLEIWN
jgi:hypothetical protein